MSLQPDDEPTIVPVPARDGVAPGPTSGVASGPTTSGLGAGNTLPLGTQLGEFEVTGLVGEGGFGIVYLAHDKVLGRNVAIFERSATTQQEVVHAITAGIPTKVPGIADTDPEAAE